MFLCYECSHINGGRITISQAKKLGVSEKELKQLPSVREKRTMSWGYDGVCEKTIWTSVYSVIAVKKFATVKKCNKIGALLVAKGYPEHLKTHRYFKNPNGNLSALVNKFIQRYHDAI